MSEVRTTYEEMGLVNEDGDPLLQLVAKEVTDRNQDSIELSVNAKGDYSWSVKVYFDDANDKTALTRLEHIDARLRDKYGKEPSQ